MVTAALTIARWDGLPVSWAHQVKMVVDDPKIMRGYEPRLRIASRADTGAAIPPPP